MFIVAHIFAPSPAADLALNSSAVFALSYVGCVLIVIKLDFSIGVHSLRNCEDTTSRMRVNAAARHECRAAPSSCLCCAAFIASRISSRCTARSTATSSAAIPALARVGSVCAGAGSSCGLLIMLPPSVCAGSRAHRVAPTGCRPWSAASPPRRRRLSQCRAPARCGSPVSGRSAQRGR